MTAFDRLAERHAELKRAMSSMKTMLRAHGIRNAALMYCRTVSAPRGELQDSGIYVHVDDYPFLYASYGSAYFPLSGGKWLEVPFEGTIEKKEDTWKTTKNS